jgi:hypothetical protein
MEEPSSESEQLPGPDEEFLDPNDDFCRWGGWGWGSGNANGVDEIRSAWLPWLAAAWSGRGAAAFLRARPAPPPTAATPPPPARRPQGVRKRRAPGAAHLLRVVPRGVPRSMRGAGGAARL